MKVNKKTMSNNTDGSDIALIIPARYASTRFPGKPLVQIAGKTMLRRVVEIAQKVQLRYPAISVAVATEDARIKAHADEIGVRCILTSEDCPTGSDRVLEAAAKIGDHIKFTIGLQGDAPFTPLAAIEKMIDLYQSAPDETEVLTPVIRLRWAELDALRESKLITPFSGTTAIVDNTGQALWFSKNIIPAIRKEDLMRDADDGLSSVYQHLGLYGFRRDILEKFVTWPQGHYEQLEGLEQLRLLENGVSIKTFTLDVPLGLVQAGVDSPEDVTRAEAALAQYGEVL
jgi:3-deoxy-manno-octulosonate cytidylyltransferase (CMP-KDO synthetase)